MNALKVKNGLSEMYAAGDDGDTTRGSPLPRQPNLSHLAKALGEIGQDLSSHLASSPPRTQDPRQGYGGKRFGEHLLENFERQALLKFHTSRPEDGADGFCRSALSPDHLA